MKHLAILLLIFTVFLSACATPTEPPIPPTSTPNPDAERIIMEFGELYNNKEIEAALALFSDEAHFGGVASEIEGKDQIEIWLKVSINTLKTSYKFSEVKVEGNDVIWNVIEQNFSGKERCEGNATIQDGLISSYNLRDCEEID